ncbi:Mu transposase domain-containing protein [Streptomyces sp. NBC_01431]|uniref:Mu transposase domain-containing protein n=1 Tax=Streptomyces sp. NBC_01431 TaxID=2903863 RepID=UPI003FCD3FA5
MDRRCPGVCAGTGRRRPRSASAQAGPGRSATPKSLPRGGTTVSKYIRRLHQLPSAPHTLALGEARRVLPDQTVRFGSVRYSTPPGLVGCEAWVRADGDELVVMVDLSALAPRPDWMQGTTRTCRSHRPRRRPQPPAHTQQSLRSHRSAVVHAPNRCLTAQPLLLLPDIPELSGKARCQHSPAFVPTPRLCSQWPDRRVRVWSCSCRARTPDSGGGS